MKQVPIIVIALVLPLICPVTADAGVGEKEEGPQATLEHLCGASLSIEVFEIEVLSNGCTEVEDFVFVIERAGASEFDVQVIRVVPDRCDGFGRTVTLRFDRESLGLDGVDVVNLQNPMCGFCPDHW